MANSELVSQMDKIQASLHPLLRGRGFRKHGRTYNRPAEEGVVHVINFQMGPADPPGTTHTSGFRENLYGLFTVNLGVFVLEVARHSGGKPLKAHIPEYRCDLRTRLAELAGSSSDIWWKVSPELAVISEVKDLLESVGFPFLGRLASRDQILTELRHATGERLGFASRPSRIIAAIILAGRGDYEGAHTLLSEQFHQTDHAGHREYLRKLADDLRLSPIDA